MIIFHNTLGGQPVSCTPWNLPAQGQYLLTVGHIERDTSEEVPMSFQGKYGAFSDSCGPGYVDEILWTQAASGGCWPFAAMARNPTRSLETPLNAMAFAHTAFQREKETQLLGELFASFGVTDPDNVYLIVMQDSAKLTDAEISAMEDHAFKTFEAGFGRSIPGDHKIILGTTTVHGAITRFGDFGEISNAQVEALSRYERLPACNRV